MPDLALIAGDPKARQVLACGSALIIIVVDAVFAIWRPPFVILGVMDEVAHLATTALLLIAFAGRLSVPFIVAALAASSLIDLDHIPYYLGWDIAGPELPRPRSHSMLPVALALVAALLLRDRARRAALGVAFGITAHLLRDTATAPVVLLWPFSLHEFKAPYVLYAALVVALAGFVLAREWMRSSRHGNISCY